MKNKIKVNITRQPRLTIGATNTLHSLNGATHLTVPVNIGAALGKTDEVVRVGNHMTDAQVDWLVDHNNTGIMDITITAAK